MKRISLFLAVATTLSLGTCNPADKSASGAASSDAAANGGVASPDTIANNGVGQMTDDRMDNAPAAEAAAKADDTDANNSAAAPGKADPTGPTGPHATDAEFMTTAAHSDQNEIQQSKMALAKGVTGMAKEMADKMIADHAKSTADLKAIAAKKGVKLPADMDAEHKAMVPTMEKLTGKDFEAKYLAQMKADHQKTANTMAAHEKMTKDADLKAFIGKTLPVVEQHLQMAEKGDGMKM